MSRGLGDVYKRQAGATAVSVGTANFVNPKTTEQIVDGIAEYMDRYGVKDISELVGAVDR